ncbi:MAG: sigma-54-dependent Fis family transcriptional regulator [Rhodocyclaceae bacterium]|nr:sigma-54-dependent Fis family transcriptional regulator [Rhodocyclaceae bacterium]
MMKHAEAIRDQLSGWKGHAVLIVDDDEGVLHFMRRALSSRCGLVESAPDLATAAALQARIHFDLILLDVMLPDGSGIDWLSTLRRGAYSGDVVLLSAFVDLESSLEALRSGASDLLLKPFRLDQLLLAVGRCFERARLSREHVALQRTLQRKDRPVDGLVGQSPPIRRLREAVQRIAPMPTTVLLEGESGTGKEVLARALHQLSPRCDRPFVPVNCAAISSQLIESELFGHVRGAFTGAADNRDGLFFYAHGGTLFLDEVSELPLPMQTKLLRALEERRIRPLGSEREIPIDVRIIAASNKSLEAEIAAGRFREDLYFRLAVVSMTLPPLRNRHEDLPDLIHYFMDRLAPHLGVAPLKLTRSDLTRLGAYAWPGNVRELKNYVERSMILGGFSAGSDAVARALEHGDEVDSSLRLDDVVRRHIEKVLMLTGGNKSEAARHLGVSRKTLERKATQWRHEDDPRAKG